MDYIILISFFVIASLAHFFLLKTADKHLSLSRIRFCSAIAVAALHPVAFLLLQFCLMSLRGEYLLLGIALSPFVFFALECFIIKKFLVSRLLTYVFYEILFYIVLFFVGILWMTDPAIPFQD